MSCNSSSSASDRGQRYASSRPSQQEAASMGLADLARPFNGLASMALPPFNSPNASAMPLQYSSGSMRSMASDHLMASETTPTAANTADSRQRLAEVLEDAVRISNNERPVHLGKRKAPTSASDMDFQQALQ